MVKATASATEIKNQFGKYLQMVMEGHEVIITKNGVEVGRIVPKSHIVSYLTESLTGILSESTDIDDARSEALRDKYEIAD